MRSSSVVCPPLGGREGFALSIHEAECLLEGDDEVTRTKRCSDFNSWGMECEGLTAYVVSWKLSREDVVIGM